MTTRLVWTRLVGASALALAFLALSVWLMGLSQPEAASAAEIAAPAAPNAPLILPPPWLSDDDVADAPFDNPPAPTVDGLIAPGEYAGAGKVVFSGYGGDVEVFFKHDANTLYVAFELPDQMNAAPYTSLFLDTNHDGGGAPQPDDFQFRVRRDNTAWEYQGNGSLWQQNTPITWTYGVTDTMTGWSVEFGIPFAKLGITPGTFQELGLALSNWGAGPAHLWPAGAVSNQPNTWGSLVSSSGDASVVPSGWGTFYWKPGPWEDYAPSGMPDFDQHQDAWSSGPISTHCGPVAMANSLWWFDSKFETLTGTMPPVVSDTYRLVRSYGSWDDHHYSNTVPLVNDLANYFGTNQGGITGTNVISMFLGTHQYLRDHGLWDDYLVSLVISPTFEWVADEVMRSEDVILLLGFYEWQTDHWARVGGHYVNVAGVDPILGQIAFSDPFLDNAEQGGMGRVLSGTLIIPHQPFHPPTVHNDAGNISHDVYSIGPTSSPGGVWGPFNYPLAGEPWPFLGANPHPNIPTESWTGEPTQVEVEFALTVSPYTWKASGEWLPESSDPVQGVWQPWQDYAPNGVPDFDQKQDNWRLPPGPLPWTFCGPVAAANSLWWFDSKFEPAPITPTVPGLNDGYPLVQSYSFLTLWDDHDPLNVDDSTTPWPPSGWPFPPPMPSGQGEFVEDLALYAQTDQIGNGTVITNLYTGIDQYITAHGLRQGYVITMVHSPEFWWVAEEVEVSEDVILLLGFWEEIAPGEYQRVGGHYVTVPGVDKQGGLVAFSDPYYDGAEFNWPYAYPGGWPTVLGRVADGWLIPHPPYYTHLPTTHNDAGNVSHDVYYVSATDSPGGVWGPWKYVEDGIPDSNFLGQNGDSVLYGGGLVQAEVDGAIAVSPVADVAITKTVVPTTAAPGDWLTFTLTFRNYGNDAEDVFIFDPLPSGLTGASYTYTLDNLGTLTHTGTYTWDVGRLRWMEGGIITVTAQVDPGLVWPVGARITNTATITTPTQEQYQIPELSNQASASFDVLYYGVDLSPDTATIAGNPGQTVTYTLSVENSGNVADSYNLTLGAHGWPTTLSQGSVGPLNPGATGNMEVYVTIPGSASNGSTDTVAVTATSQGDGSQTDSSMLTTTATTQVITRGVALAPPTAAQTGDAGTTVTYTLRVTNTGSVADNIVLNAAATWTITLSANNLYLNSGQGATVYAYVSIPTTGVNDGDHDIATVTARSNADPSQRATATLTTTARVPSYGVDLQPPTGSGVGNPANVVTYTLTVKNTGNVADSYNLTLGTHGWTTILSQGSVGPLNPGATGNVEVYVTIPGSASNGSADTVAVTATSQGDGSQTDTSVLTTTATTQVITRGVALAPPTAAQTGDAGTTVTYTLRVTNTGSVADNIVLNAAATWTTTLSANNLYLNSGQGATVYAYVQIPASAAPTSQDAATVTATSANSTAATDSVALTTRVKPVTLYLPLVIKNYP